MGRGRSKRQVDNHGADREAEVHVSAVTEETAGCLTRTSAMAVNVLVANENTTRACSIACHHNSSGKTILANLV